MPRLSVIIPTYQRSDILRECLRCLEKQTVADSIEVIIVSDGHDDKTAALFSNSTWRISVRFFEIAKSQQGAARNVGVQYATGERVLFIGDDIFLAPDACEKHMNEKWSVVSGQWLEKELPTTHYPLPAILGFTTWDPAVGITPVMRWLEKSGWQFGYHALNRSLATGAGPMIPRAIQHQYSYTSHISLPLSVGKKIPFRTDVHLYGWEDIEWGMRLRDAGVQLVYEPDARALHHHRMTMEDSLKRMETLGRSAVEIKKMVPEFDRVPSGWKLFAYRVFSLLPTISGKHRKAFLSGLAVKQFS